MTVLNFITAEKVVFIVMDSSFSDPDDMQPAGYISKAYLLPHLEGIIAGTGIARFIADWFVLANTGFVVRDMVHLNRFVQPQLQKLFAPYREKEPDVTSTVYHWGYDREAGTMVTYRYSSRSNFESEALGTGNMNKPSIDLGDYQINEFPADYLPIMERQKLADEALPLDQRVGIGGHMIAYQMQAFDDEAGVTHVNMMTRRVAPLSGYLAAYINACRKRERG